MKVLFVNQTWPCDADPQRDMASQGRGRPPRHFMREVYMFSVQRRELSGGIVRAWLIQAKAQSKEKRAVILDWRRMASRPGPASLGNCEDRSLGGPKATPSSATHLSCRTIHSTGASSGWAEGGRGFAGVYSHFEGVQLEDPVVQAFREA